MNKVYCPYCRKNVSYDIEKRDLKEFRGIKINSYENVAICNECKNDLYVDEIENKNNERIYGAYRIKANIIKPQDIIDLRKKYNISQRELTAILGFGKMTINRYERGGVPTKSQSDYIKLLIENDNEFLNKAREAFENGKISKKTFDKVESCNSESNEIKSNIQDLYKLEINCSLNKKPNIYNGYKEFNLDKVENILSYIASKVKNLTITSLNKYLWFIDCLSFKQRGTSITGLTYQNQQYGPTIINQKYKEISLLDDKYTREEYEDECGTKTNINSNNNYDLSDFDKKEIKIINEVIDLLKDKSVTDISKLSHEEDGWKKTNRFDQISFEYSMKLNSLN